MRVSFVSTAKMMVGLTMLSCSACGSAAEEIDPKVAEIASLSRETKATYSLYMWNRITLEGVEPRDDWSAEFHRGAQHRVETSGDRLVADCMTMKGAHLKLATGKTSTDDWVAKAACGINANRPILKSKFLGQVGTPFGPAQRIRMTDQDNIRTYDVVKSGALVAQTIADLDGTMRVENVATELLATVPEGDIFSETSLQSSAVADRYKERPSPKN